MCWMPLKLVSHNVKDKKVKLQGFQMNSYLRFLNSFQSGVQNFFIFAMTLRIIGMCKSINQFCDRKRRWKIAIYNAINILYWVGVLTSCQLAIFVLKDIKFSFIILLIIAFDLKTNLSLHRINIWLYAIWSFAILV